MIDSLLPSKICQTREEIREAVARYHENQRYGGFRDQFGSEGAEIVSWLDRLRPLAESFKPGLKKSDELLWLLEELAAGFPGTTMKAMVWWGVIIPVMKKAGLVRTQMELSPLVRKSNEEPALAYNHLFLPVPASKIFKLLSPGLVSRTGVEADLDQNFPVFDLPSGKRILVPAVADTENIPETGVRYYLVEDESLNLEKCPAGKNYFPFRPAVCRWSKKKVPTRNIEPILSLTAEAYQARLETYFLLLAAVFSGWARAGWQGLVHSKQGCISWPGLDTEISYLTTEIGRLQLGLFHLSQSWSRLGTDRFRKVEKLCLLGLHLASRAWRYCLARFPK